MRYQQLIDFSDAAFKRYCGVKRALFDEMVEVLEAAERAKRKPGRPSELSVADQLGVWQRFVPNWAISGCART